MSAALSCVVVLGATGMTGRWVVKQLLDKSCNVKAVVRDPARLPKEITENANFSKLTVITGTVLDLAPADVDNLVKDSDAVVSCLGHNITFDGMYRAPYDVCEGSARKIHQAIEKQSEDAKKCKFVMINTVGVPNPDPALKEKEARGFGDRMLLGLVRTIAPPHVDNEKAVAYLTQQAAKGSTRMEWCAVRPDSLIDSGQVSPYEVMESPTTTITGGKATSRINVANFMVRLLEEEDLWNKWKFAMPVINDLEKVKAPK